MELSMLESSSAVQWININLNKKLKRFAYDDDFKISTNFPPKSFQKAIVIKIKIKTFRIVAKIYTKYCDVNWYMVTRESCCKIKRMWKAQKVKARIFYLWDTIARITYLFGTIEFPLFFFWFCKKERLI